jgi:uncharacterized protein
VWLTHLAFGLAALYAAVVAAMYLARTWLLFPTALAGVARVQLPASARRLEASTPDGEVLAGVRVPAAAGEGAEGRAPTLLGFGGNAWTADAVAFYLHGLFPDCELAAFHCRGYAPSTGRPSAQALLADSALVFDRFQQEHASGRGVVAVGLGEERSCSSANASSAGPSTSAACCTTASPHNLVTQVGQTLR